MVGLYRFGIAALILTPWILWNRPAKTNPSENLPFKVFLIPLAGGLFSAFDYGLWSLGIKYTTIGNATLLSNSASIWVSLVAIVLFHERFKPIFWVGLVLTIFGVSAVIRADFSQHHTFAYGDVLGLASGFFFAGYFLITQVGRQHLNSITYFWIMNIGCAMTLFMVCLSLNLPILGYSIQTYLIFVVVAILFQFLGYYSIVYALGHLTASIVSPTMMLQPVFASILAFSLLGEKMIPIQMVGGLIALIGIYFVNLGKKQPVE